MIVSTPQMTRTTSNHYNDNRVNYGVILVAL